MSQLLPKYLHFIAHQIVEKKRGVSCKLKCECGNSSFYYFKSQDKDLSNNAFDKYWDSLRVPVLSINEAIEHKSGKKYFYGKTFFGIHVGKFMQKICLM